MVEVIRGYEETIRETLYTGLKAHSASRVEHVTIGIQKGSGTSLMGCFETLCKRLSLNYRKFKIEYAGVLVGNPPEHGHILWVKPYIRYNDLNAMWCEITGQVTATIRSQSVRGDKSTRNGTRRLVNYISGQGEHHCCVSPVILVKSHKWGVTPRKFTDKTQETLEDVL